MEVIIKTVGIILVMYKQAQHLSLLYQSLYKQTFKDFRVYFTDNNKDLSDKETSEELNKEFRLDIKYLHPGYNSGFAAGNNIGAHAAMEDGCENVFFLNNDTELHEDCINELVIAMKSDARIGMCAPVIFYGTSNSSVKIIQELGARADFGSYKITKQFEGASFDVMGSQIPGVLDVDLVTGGAALASTEALKKTGLWEESYFAYGDEIDLAKRFKEAGIRTVAVSGAMLWHNHKWDKTNKSGYYFEYYLIQRNKYLYFRKYGLRGRMLISLAADSLKFPWRLLWFIKVCDFRLGLYYLKGTLHGLLGKSGRPAFVEG